MFYQSRYAQRVPIGKPDILRSAPPERVRAFYDTWYRPERMGIVAVGDVDLAQMEKEIRSTFGPLQPRAPAAPPPNDTVPMHSQLLVSATSDPEMTQSSVEIVLKRPRERDETVGDYRRGLIDRLIGQMFDERFQEIAQRPTSPFLGAGIGGGPLGQTASTFSIGANAKEGGILDSLTVLTLEAKRVQQYGFTASELDRAKKSMAAFYDRAYNERDKSESGIWAAELLRHFLVGEPVPGIAYEYRVVQSLLPSITLDDVSALARTRLRDGSRVVLAVSPDKPGLKLPGEAELQAALKVADSVGVTPWAETLSRRELIETKPTPGEVTSRRELKDLGITIVQFSNGVEAWLKPTDFKNDQVVFTMYSKGGSSVAPPSEFINASLAASFVGQSGFGGLDPLEIDKLLAGASAGATPFIGLSTHGISGSAAPAQLETGLQLLYTEFTAPNDDPNVFSRIKGQLDAAVEDRGQTPEHAFGEKAELVNTSNHYTAEPLTAEMAARVDRAKMLTFYRDRFSNAADFTMFVVGTFKVDEAIPLLARYVGSLPSTGKRVSQFKDVGIHFPSASERAVVQKGREPRSQTVISFFADPSDDPMEQEKVMALTSVLEASLRDILREQMGQTYGVSVDLSQSLPQRGGGHIEVSFAASPDNITAMTDRVVREVKRLQEEGPSADLTARAKEAARRDVETALRQNGYWLRGLQTIHMLGHDPTEITTRNARIEQITPAMLKEAFVKYFPLDRYTIVTLVPETIAAKP